MIRGKPLFLWAAGNLSKVLPKSQIYVHSDSDAILEIAKRYGYQALKRPENLSTNQSTGDELMLWEAEQIDCDVIVQHLPPMAFLRRNTLDEIIGPVVKGENDSAFGVYRVASYGWDAEGPKYSTERLPNSDQLPLEIHEGMGIYCCSRESLLAHKRRTSGRYKMVDLDFFERLDIDYPQQLEMVQSIGSALGGGSEYLSPTYQDDKMSFREMEVPACLMLDVDGVQTNASVHVDPVGVSRAFNSKDGQGIKDLLANGIEVVFVTAAEIKGSIARRAEMLGVQSVLRASAEDKFEVCSEFLRQKGKSWENAWYAGDDTPDLLPMLAAGMSFSPSDAHKTVLSAADFVSELAGGDGFVREIADLALKIVRRRSAGL
jgi:YrbI family 3-deoxy-D-manno-octulosonate 8-phosphate phosphatase